MSTVRLAKGGFLTFSNREQTHDNADQLAAARQKIQDDGYNGQLSLKAKSKIRRYASNWLTALNAKKGNCYAPAEQSRDSLTFVTLTLPFEQFHTDHEIRRNCLRPFLQELKRKFGAHNYLWRAEPQKNKSIHFHILLDVKIHWRKVRDEWNKVLKKAGYIRWYAENMQYWHRNGFRVREDLLKYWPIDRQRNAYEYGKKTNWQDPNTTDIHALRDVKNVVAYVVKYMVKEQHFRKIEGRIWECSDSIRNLESCEIELTSDFDMLLKELTREGKLEKVVGDGFVFYRCDIQKIMKEHYQAGYEYYKAHWHEECKKLRATSSTVVEKQKKPRLCSARAKPDI